MTRFNWLATVGALVAIAGCSQGTAPVASTPAAPSGDCDRACLGEALDAYLAAVVAHDPGKAPLAYGIRQTENAVNFAPGQRVWQSVTGLGEVQRKYFDPVTGQAGYYGTVREGEETPIVTVRLRVEDRKITEAEWYVARANDPGLAGPRQPGQPPANLHNPEYLAQNPPPQRTVAAAERIDRAALARVVDSYFDAITSHDGSIALTHKGCGRAENGHPAPGGDFLPPAPPRGNQPAPQPAQQPGVGSRDCVTGLENFNLSMVVARRMPLIDEEAQMVLATGVFVRRPGSPTPRNAASWWFVIDQGRIRTTYTAMFYPPATLAVPNWPPYDGHWPLAESVVPPPLPARK